MTTILDKIKQHQKAEQDLQATLFVDPYRFLCLYYSPEIILSIASTPTSHGMDFSKGQFTRIRIDSSGRATRFSDQDFVGWSANELQDVLTAAEELLAKEII
jgi:hypothetical protein